MSTDIIVHSEPVPLLPMPANEAALMMERYRALCEAILTPDDVIGIPGQQGGFIKRSGYSKFATFYGASTRILVLEERRNGDGEIVGAKALVRATHPNGRQEDGDGACAISEPRFRTPTGRQKAEHDIPATAVTRARNRAISNLIGFGAVSAEEVDESNGSVPSPPFGPPATVTQEDGFLRALEGLGAQAPAVAARIYDKAGGYLPKIVAMAVMYAAASALEHAQAEPEAGDGEPGTDGDDEPAPEPAEPTAADDAAVDAIKEAFAAVEEPAEAPAPKRRYGHPPDEPSDGA